MKKLFLRNTKFPLLFVLFFIFSNFAQTISFNSLYENFEQFPISDWKEGQDYGQWYDNFNGYGSVGVFSDTTQADGSEKALYQMPQASESSGETHACLVTSQMAFNNFSMSLQMKTIKQLRTPKPNAWETAWVFWHYIDNTRFYYFILKPNGWELGKEDPSYPYNQRFLVTGSSPALQMNTYHFIEVTQKDSTMTISVDSQQVVTFTDKEHPYLDGKIGLYNEDAHVAFDNINVLEDSLSTPVHESAPSPEQFSLTAYPNPFNNRITVKFNNGAPKATDISIYDINGRLLLNKHMINTNMFQWNGLNTGGNNSGSGLYLIRVKQAGLQKTIKVIQLK